MKIHLKNFDILTSLESQPIREGSVLVENGRIEKVSQDPLPESEVSVDRTIDGQGKLLFPGFVNTHSHLGMTIFRGYADDIELDKWLRNWIWPAEENLTPDEVYWGSLLAIVESVHSGVTTIADMYFYMDQTARAVEESGIRGLLSYGIIADELDEKGKAELKTALDLVDEWDGEANGRLNVALSPHAPYTCGEDVLRRIAKISEDEGIPIHTHISETRKEVEDSREEYGLSPVERLAELGVLDQEVLAAHCVHLSDRDVETLAKSGVVVAHNPTSNMKLASGAAPVKKLKNAGVKVTLGTDGPGTNNDLDMFGEMRQASFLAKLREDDPTALSAEETLGMATAKGIDQFGFPGLSVIEEGVKADLVSLDRNLPHWIPEYDTISNLVYSGKESDVDMVMVDGSIILEDGKMTTVDEQQVVDKVKEISKKYGKLRQTHN